MFVTACGTNDNWDGEVIFRRVRKKCGRLFLVEEYRPLTTERVD
jgi:hypothetical protein